MQRKPFMKPGVRLFKTAILLTLSLIPLTGEASAQQPTQAQTNAVRQYCRGDYQSYCASVPTGGKASLQCLQQHEAALSPDCHSAVAAISGGSPGAAASSGGTGALAPSGQSQQHPPMTERKIAFMRQSCGRDFRAYCHGVELGGGKAIGCLEANESRLSPSCRAGLAEMHGSR
jgi:hypothetical protein